MSKRDLELLRGCIQDTAEKFLTGEQQAKEFTKECLQELLKRIQGKPNKNTGGNNNGKSK